jgi:hypothetical protein
MAVLKGLLFFHRKELEVYFLIKIQIFFIHNHGLKEMKLTSDITKRFGKFASEKKNCEIKNTKAKQG